MPDPRTPRPFAHEYVDLVVRAYSNRAGEPALPVARSIYATLFKLRAGVKVQVWFRRYTPSKIPELRIGIVFDVARRAVNTLRGDTFFAAHAPDLAALGFAPWPSDSDNDRRYMTPLLCPAGADLDDLSDHAAELAMQYVELLKRVVLEGSPTDVRESD